MTVSSSVRATSYAGSDAYPDPKDFAFGFKIFDDADLQVTLRVDATGVETVQTIVTHYTVTGAGDDNGGTVTMLTAPNTGETLIIERIVATTQPLDLRTNGNYLPDSIEDAFDRITMISQQLDTLGDALPEYAIADRPVASASYAGKRIMIKDTGVPAYAQICLEKATDDTYSWVTSATGEF